MRPMGAGAAPFHPGAWYERHLMRRCAHQRTSDPGAPSAWSTPHRAEKDVQAYSRHMTKTRWRPGDPVDWEHPGELWTAGGLHSFVLETIGARSGLVRRAVLGYLDDGADGWLIIGSKGGAPVNPAWVANLAAHPDATVVLADGTRVPVHAERLAGAELDDAWRRIDTEAPEYPVYRSRTQRAIPVIRLLRRAG